MRATFRTYFAARGFVSSDSSYAHNRLSALSERLERGETAYVVGLGVSGHNSGCALVEVSPETGVRLLFNDEEERHVGIKHYPGFPEHSLEELRRELAGLGLLPDDIHAWLAGWDYPAALASTMALFAEEFPRNLDSTPNPHLTPQHMFKAASAPATLGRQFGAAGHIPIIAMPHHHNHAFFPYAVSPFAGSNDPVMVSVIDGYGDDNAISTFKAIQNEVRLLTSNSSRVDSLGAMYAVISSTQGGWTLLSSEGRYMGAAAWGDGDRLTNPYYRQLRQILHFGPDGELHINRAFANWNRKGFTQPYRKRLEAILGPPISLANMWNPDAVLDVDTVEHVDATTERVDKAAALQLVFEDGLFHVVENLIRRTGSHKLVLTGGTALNCVANQRLLDYFDESWYERYLGLRDTRLHLWVPPVPGDAGMPPGAAFQFALLAGAKCGPNLQHAFYNGLAPTTEAIREALESVPEIAYQPVGSIASEEGLRSVADFVASVISQDGILGLFQGSAETGPRALGHRSILANPCNPATLEAVNARVKFRERIRPLCPMVTAREASKWFDLSPGASDADYNAYNYMVLTAPARDEAKHRIPAAVHRDGTARIQIVREATDPFVHAFLVAMGRRAGVEVSINTSLNVGGPIVQRPDQALETLKRSRGMDGLVFIGSNGDAYLAWHDVETGIKDSGRRLMAWLEEWRVGHAQEVGANLPCTAGSVQDD